MSIYQSDDLMGSGARLVQRGLPNLSLRCRRKYGRFFKCAGGIGDERETSFSAGFFCETFTDRQKLHDMRPVPDCLLCEFLHDGCPLQRLL